MSNPHHAAKPKPASSVELVRARLDSSGGGHARSEANVSKSWSGPRLPGNGPVHSFDAQDANGGSPHPVIQRSP